MEQINIETALDSIYNISIEMGADAIMDFNLHPYTEEYTNIQNPVTVDGIQITGIAIKRQN